MRWWLAGLAWSIATVTLAATPAERGAQRATMLGCRSCHGADVQGRAQIDDPTIATLWASNLTRAVPRYTDAQLARVLQRGVRPDGSHLWVMTAAPYAVLSRRDLRDVTAWLRSLPPAGPHRPRIAMGPRFIKAVKAGRFAPESLTLARDLAAAPIDLGPMHARGRYLARTICAGCHGPDLAGAKDWEPGLAPPLGVAAAYDGPAFRTLLHTGIASGGREVGIMTQASRERFAAISDADADAILGYLKIRAAR